MSQVKFSDSGEDRVWRRFPIGPQQGQARLPEVLVGPVDEGVQAAVQVWHHWWQRPEPIRCRRQVHPAQQNQLMSFRKEEEQRWCVSQQVRVRSAAFTSVAQMSFLYLSNESRHHLGHHEGRVAQDVGGHQQRSDSRQISLIITDTNKERAMLHTGYTVTPQLPVLKDEAKWPSWAASNII